MGVSVCPLNLNSASRELQSHGSIEFPCAAYHHMHSESKEEYLIPWHYHEEIEIIYIKEGSMEVKTPSCSSRLNEGEAAIINSNELHFASTNEKCDMNSLVFSSLLITGRTASVFEKKYIRPLIASRAFSLYKVEKGDEIISLFSSAFSSIAEEKDGYEFIARENLSKICYFLYKTFESSISKEKSADTDEIRLKKMLDYIHQNYMRDISLKDIAKEANISERECLRCFQKTIEYSPIQYLIKYRVQKGSELLLSNKELSISEIASECGFESPSNFSKFFKRYYLTSPREYRAMHNQS